MKVFLCGLPKSGRTTVAKALDARNHAYYIDAMSWVRSTFRSPKEGEHIHQYEDEYHQFLSKRMQVNPNFVIDHVNQMMKINYVECNPNFYIIDGISSPKDFISLFDYNKDIIVFLNRTDNDNDHEYRDHENIGTSVIRDYCFWMSSAGLLNKQRWLEYNFRIPGENSDHVKSMGAQNSVFIVKSINKVISHVTDQIKEVLNAISN